MTNKSCTLAILLKFRYAEPIILMWFRLDDLKNAVPILGKTTMRLLKKRNHATQTVTPNWLPSKNSILEKKCDSNFSKKNY
jgi:hypothetical protein